MELKLDSHVGATQPAGCWVSSFSPFTQPVYDALYDVGIAAPTCSITSSASTVSDFLATVIAPST
ncbi:unannotated protein [freshwater metagenome]|uniref:Unannotated protein n=1 Tax=freshwater metagenome TaxID=449393 RepID=A0A6J7K8N2_9ZZZZ